MGRMNDEDVSRLLRELPREGPSFDFTARVLAKVDSRPRSGRRNRAFVRAGVLAALLGVVLSQGYLRERYQRSKAAARVRELRDEHPGVLRSPEMGSQLGSQAQHLDPEITAADALPEESPPVVPSGLTLATLSYLANLARRGKSG